MIYCECIHKFRDKNGVIYGYTLKDTQGNTQNVVPEQLKSAIKSGKVSVNNLKLTTDNRLVDSNANHLKDNKLFTKDVVTPMSKDDKFLDWFNTTVDNLMDKMGCGYIPDSDDPKSQYGLIYSIRGITDFDDVPFAASITLDANEEVPHIRIGIDRIDEDTMEDEGIEADITGRNSPNPLSESSDLTYPLYSAENMDTIKRVFNEFYKGYVNEIHFTDKYKFEGEKLPGKYGRDYLRELLNSLFRLMPNKDKVKISKLHRYTEYRNSNGAVSKITVTLIVNNLYPVELEVSKARLVLDGVLFTNGETAAKYIEGKVV